MSTPLMPTPGAGFDQPFELLSACHDRVQRSLDLLRRLQDHLAIHGADGQAQDAARDVLRYFDIAAPLHHEDEERHVFPALLAADAGRHGALVARLQDDHRRMAAAWPAARAALQAVADGRWTTEGASPAVQAWQDFAALYGPHIDAEEQLAYPAARALADAEAAHAMGTEMAARRGLTAVNPSR
ncbi:MAG: hemerythrin domain-containing protein [Burkholderiaceae bacterium]|nr:hemerythrin domain-containing protein [Burkholderiaceae bacterium]